MRKPLRHEAMTLLEIMVVIVIMSLLATAVAVSVLKSLEDSRTRDTNIRARTIQTVATAYVMDEGDCPTIGDLENRLDPTTEHTDAWGGAFVIECDGNVIHVRSAGADGQPRTEDDLGF